VSLTSPSNLESRLHPLCLGGNVFGWTVGAADAGTVLDAYAELGGTFLDTADQYVDWTPGGRGGESEAMIGAWMAERGNRDVLAVATKVGKGPDAQGLTRASIRTSVEASLRRLGTDRIDVYYAHEDDPDAPLEETVAALDELVREGKVLALGASNYRAERLQEALDVADGGGWERFAFFQPHYNLAERHRYEGPLSDVVARAGMACVPYFSLASGFLTGKYRPGADVDSARSRMASRHLTEQGVEVLAVLDDVATAHGATVAAVSLAWLARQPTVRSVLASARTPEQVAELMTMTTAALTDEELTRLDTVSTPSR
jgi:aryl-alcohol dehydrogenase-like predicted oxidoreductase